MAWGGLVEVEDRAVKTARIELRGGRVPGGALPELIEALKALDGGGV